MIKGLQLTAGTVALLSNREQGKADAASVTAAPVVPKGPLPKAVSDAIKAEAIKVADMAAQANSLGYRAQLMAQGGEADVTSFQSRLEAYLKTTKLMSWAVAHKD